jgi:hypothetical protein
VSCRFSRETLALHAEGDLPGAAAAATISHLAACEECRRFLEELQASQALMKSARRETVSSWDCTAMRREVMTIINERTGRLGWGMRIERAIALGLRPSYGMAAFLLLGILSVSVLAQIRPATHGRVSPAVLEGSDTLLRPDGYRHWTLVSGAVAADAATGGLASGDHVYINPSSYQEYAKTGRFPEGTVLVWEPAAPEQAVSRGGPHATSSTLLVSLKDSTRFEGGWGFFDFSGTGGAPPPKARALPGSRGCRTCHHHGPLSMG